ncbi:MAG: RNA polymerase factor sigma-54 [Verrucomicrobiota bacterium]
MPDIGLQQQMGLSQTLSPQMQQSLHYLQAPVMELRSLIHQEMQSNPVLEENALESENNNEDWEQEFDEIRKQEDEWRDYFQQSRQTSNTGQDAQKKRDFWLESQVECETLSQHLIEQLHLSLDDDRLIAVGEEIVGNLDENGFLNATIEELIDSLGVEKEHVESALDIVQHLHPPGVGARDLAESLLIQLRHRGRAESLEFLIVQNHFDQLGRRRYQEIAKQTKSSLDRVQEAADYIAQLQPRPGSLFSPDSPQTIVQAEAAILKVDGEWKAQLNEDPLPRLRISHTYKDLLGQASHDDQVRNYLKDRIRSGKFLIKCIAQRQETMTKLLEEIILRQSDFLQEGISGLKPMTMSQVAAAIGVHETTISRAVANKHVQTPWGVFPLKFFFTSGYRTQTGAKMSNTSVKERIQELINHEDTVRPLSDSDIVDLLQEEGLTLARRTVAKYRTESNILPSHLRKRNN